MAAWAIWTARVDAWREASITAQSLAMSLARNVEGSLTAYDRSLLAVARAVATASPDPVGGDATVLALTGGNSGGGDAGRRDTTKKDGSPSLQILLDTLTGVPDLGRIEIANADGAIVATTRFAGATADGASGDGVVGDGLAGGGSGGSNGAGGSVGGADFFTQAWQNPHPA